MGCLLSIDFFLFFKVNFLVICPSKINILIWKLKGKWHFGATFIDNEGKNVIGCIYLMNITGARGTDHPPFSNFLFTNLFSIKFLYFFIISSLFPYFNLFVSIFIQSYVNIKLHVSTLLDTNNTQGMQLGRFKNRTPARFEYIYCTLFPLCHSN